MYLGAIGLCWAVLAAGFVIRKRPPGARDVRRARRWTPGLVLQAAAITLMWALPRAGAPEANPVLGIPAVLLAALSAGFMIASQRELGRQFAYQARLVEDHRLVTTGPYRVVRNPIYLGLYGLALANALVWTSWVIVPVFTLVYAAGTAIRIVVEQRLLRGHFGAEFDQWARRVPAVIPGLHLRAK
jgi:protein-S-isoprenylcysteine O-methyltransferase Ste14